MKVLVYLDKSRLAPKGGPFAVGYFYYQEILKNKDEEIEFIDNSKGDIADNKKKNALQIIEKRMPKIISNLLLVVRTVLATRRILYGKPKPSKVDLSKYDVVHFHDTLQMWFERENLSEYKGIVCLQSHSPIPRGQEICSGMPKLARFLMPRCEKLYERIDRFSFERADYIIFPCKEAEEPYELLWPYYKEIQRMKENSYRYILTGIEECCPKRVKTDVRKELGVPDNGFLISYIGRHNEVKGFDLLKTIASKIFELSDDAWVVSAGKEEPIKRLSHSNWKEIGFTDDAHSYISASNVFVLPNRMTYFDIVMIEVLSLGKIVVASRTGGNKYFEKEHVKGVFLYDTIEEAVDILLKIKKMSADEIDSLEKANRRFFLQELSVSKMYLNYKNFLNSINLNK